MRLELTLDHPAEQILARQVGRLGLTPAQVIGRALTLYSIACATVPPPPRAKPNVVLWRARDERDVLWCREWEEAD